MSSDNTEKDWIAISAAKISRRESLIPSEYRLSKEYLDGHADIAVVNAVRESGLLSEKELIIVYSDGKEILGKLRSRDWTSVEVTTAFIKSSAVAHQVVCTLPSSGYPELGFCTDSSEDSRRTA